MVITTIVGVSVLYVGGVVCFGFMGFCALALGRSDSYLDLFMVAVYALLWPLLALYLLACTLLEMVGILDPMPEEDWMKPRELSEKPITSNYRKKR
jgi:hypothetical protein